MRPETGFRIAPNLPEIGKMTMTSQIAGMTLSSNFFWCYRLSVVNFSYWSKFYVNILTSSRVITIFLYEGSTRSLEIGNTSVWILPNIWRLEKIRDTKFWQMSLMKCYWMLQNTRVTAAMVSDSLRKNQRRSKISPPPPPPPPHPPHQHPD